MTLLKTKEAAHQLAVSETTVRRWVSTFPASFRKDMFGHYIFDTPAMDKLRKIKGQLDAGTALYDIRLLSLAEEETLAAVAAEVMGTTEAAHPVAEPRADKSEESGRLAVDAAGNVHVSDAAVGVAAGIGRAGGVVDQAGNLHTVGSGSSTGHGRNNVGALVVDSAGNVYAAGGEAGAQASAEITTGLQHAAAAVDTTVGDRISQAAPSPAVSAPPSPEASQVIVPSASIHSSSSAIDETDPMLERLNAIEAALSQKADEVVTVQLLHHRKELEELRKSLTELAATIEALRSPQQELLAFGESAKAAAENEGKRKKRGLRSFFFF
ncbi:DNA-binding transcriptional MerR regulator [Paenibacillus sp. BK033]|uniref:MerR family transcriptional regulator n=1 Tax=Paenibacillus sp. BK033 TaxID=2512133 RepID=UPI00104864BE|nr:MerR family transcriptional regulator [Paenibacillus sp. BK033]TCM92879.1 DNA-binding transcriptional MerR regulator [Paenibacillus sp. BK033]